MLIAIVDTFEICGVDLAASIFVKDFEGLVDFGLSGFIQWPSDASKEFIEIELAITVFIEVTDELLSLILGNGAPIFCKSLNQVIAVQFLITLPVKILKDSCISSDRGSTSRVESRLDFLYESSFHDDISFF